MLESSVRFAGKVAVWLNTGDNSFNVMVLACSPLITLCLIGLLGNGGV